MNFALILRLRMLSLAQCGSIPTLYQQIGARNIENLVVAFYQNVLVNPVLQPSFGKTPIEKSQRMQIESLAIALGSA